jgi:hypothetical protein
LSWLDKAGKLHLKFWKIEAGVQADALENIIADDKQIVAGQNAANSRQSWTQRQIQRAWQAADVGGQDALGTSLHVAS